MFTSRLTIHRQHWLKILLCLSLAVVFTAWAQQPQTQQQAADTPAAETTEPEAQSVQPVSPEPEAASEPAVDTEVVTPTAAPHSTGLPHNLSPWGMFMAADIVVKAVMFILALASLLTWTALVAKSVEFRRSSRALRADLTHIVAARSLSDLLNTGAIQGISQRLIDAAQSELHLSAGRSPQPCAQQQRQDAANTEHFNMGIKERIISSLSRIEIGYGRKLLIGTGLLATIGAVAPFVGLFGTVWGIMNSFIGISQANTTNLAVVAPGIAEALLATALGLAAAIPAVVIYNVFTRQIAGIKVCLADCSAAIMRLVSRDLDLNISSSKPE